MKHSTVLLSLFLLTTPSWSQTTPITLSKPTTAITEPLTPAGLPDYAAALNARYGTGVTPETNGYILWLRAIPPDPAKSILSAPARQQFYKLLGTPEPAADAPHYLDYNEYLKTVKNIPIQKLDDLSTRQYVAGIRLWTENDFPELAEYNHALGKIFAVIEQAAAKPRWFVPALLNDDGTLIISFIDSLALQRGVAEALSARATFRAAANDFDGFLQDILTIKRLARHMASEPAIMSVAVAHVCNMRADRAAGAAIAAGKLNAAQVDSLSAALAALPPMKTLADDANTAERWSQLQVALSLADPAVPWPQPISVASGRALHPVLRARFESIDRDKVNWNLVLTRINAHSDALVKSIDIPAYPDAVKADEEIAAQVKNWNAEFIAQANLHMWQSDTQAAYSERIARCLLGILNPPITGHELAARRARMFDDMLTILLAAAKVRAQSGAWPTTAEELVPAQLKELPRDLLSPNAASPLRYLLTPEGPRIYSLGPDGIDSEGHQYSAEKTDDPHLGTEPPRPDLP